MWVVTLIIVLFLGTITTIPMAKFKWTRGIPKALILILIGILLAGSNDTFEGTLWNSPYWMNPGSDEIKEAFSIVAMGVTGTLMYYAGHEINTRTLLKQGPAPVLMGIIPSLCEGMIIGLILSPILNAVDPELHWSFAFAGGFAVAAATPGIIIPIIMKYKNRGYSKKSGINDAIIVGASLDDITAIVMFVIFFNMGLPSLDIPGSTVTTPDSWEVLLVQTVWMVVFSIMWGMAFGAAIWAGKLLQDKMMVNETTKVNEKVNINFYKMVHMIFLLAMMYGLFFVSEAMKDFNIYAHFEFLLSVMVAGLFVSHKWRSPKYVESHKKAPEDVEEIGTMLSKFWDYIGMPIVFINVGTNFSFQMFINTDVFIAVWIILAGLTARGIGVVIATYSKSFTWKERLFGGLAFIPKGTSTAGVVVLMGVMAGGVDNLPDPFLHWVLLIAGVALVLTIPLSPAIIEFSATRLLEPPEGEEMPHVIKKRANEEVKTTKPPKKAKETKPLKKEVSKPDPNSKLKPPTKKVTTKSKPPTKKATTKPKPPTKKVTTKPKPVVKSVEK